MTAYFDIFHTLYVNETFEEFPYYHIRDGQILLSLTQNRHLITLTTANSIGLTLDTATYTLCLDVPDCPEYWGNETLCGLAGNFDGSCSNDLVYRSGKLLSPSSVNQCAYGQSVSEWANEFITEDYFTPDYLDEICSPGSDNINIADWFGKTNKTMKSQPPVYSEGTTDTTQFTSSSSTTAFASTSVDNDWSSTATNPPTTSTTTTRIPVILPSDLPNRYGDDGYESK